MKSKNLTLLSLSLSIILLTRCQEDQPFLEYKQQGYVKGTITGTSYDGVTKINESFSYTQFSTWYGSTDSHYYINNEGIIIINLDRTDFTTGGRISMYLELETEDATAPDYTSLTLYYKKNKAGEAFDFDMGSYHNETTFSNFNFDMATGRFTSDFTITGEENSTHYEATMTGSINATLKRQFE